MAASSPPFTRATRLARLPHLLAARILVLDGAMGTMIQRHELTESGYRGERFHDWGQDLKGNNDLLTLTQPEIITGIHAAYLDAGADILETNTFNSTAVSQADYGMESLVLELNEAGARLARSVADRFEAADPSRPRFVAGVLWQRAIFSLALIMPAGFLMGFCFPVGLRWMKQIGRAHV